jgi:cytochrome c
VGPAKRLLIVLTGSLAYAATAAAAAPRPPAWSAVLPKADLQDGRRESVQCMQCHDLTADKSNRFGPPLWGIVGRPRATAPAYRYSEAMRASHAPWTLDRLDAYLKAPQAYVPGTPMSFPGIRDARRRANLIAYLLTLSDAPPAIPPVRGSRR